MHILLINAHVAPLVAEEAPRVNGARRTIVKALHTNILMTLVTPRSNTMPWRSRAMDPAWVSLMTLMTKCSLLSRISRVSRRLVFGIRTRKFPLKALDMRLRTRLRKTRNVKLKNVTTCCLTCLVYRLWILSWDTITLFLSLA